MKKTTFFKASLGIAAFVFIAGFSAQGQITLTKSDMPQIGSTYIDANDTNPIVTPGSAGVNQTWNLSAMHNDYLDTVYALSPSSSPYASYYPNTNLMMRTDIVGAGETDEFINLSADSETATGSVLPVSTILYFGFNKPGTVGVAFPATYKSNWSGSYIDIEKANEGGGDSVKGVTLYEYHDTVDGWGTVTTPAGTYNALRIKTIFTPIYDSNYYNLGSGWVYYSSSPLTPTEEFSWYAQGKGVEVAYMNLKSVGGAASSALYLFTSVASIDKVNNDASAKVYPDPASSNINIELSSNSQTGYVKIFDLTGREIETSPFNNGKAQLNTSNYANGMYLYMITDMNGNLLDKGKFTVSH